MTEILAGLTLGFAGSVHCVAMCGPLVLALRPVRTFSQTMLYHATRVSVYAAAGLIGGLVGQTLDLAGLGSVLSIVAGTLLLLAAAKRVGLDITPHATGWIGRPLALSMSAARRHTTEGPIAGVLVAGAVNALLPCGLVYAALVAAAAFGSASRAALFMVSFGVGTVPALAAMSLFARSIPAALRSRARFAVPLTLALIGLLLIVRGSVSALPHDGHVSRTASHSHMP